MELAHERSLKLIRKQGVFGPYWRMILLVGLLYALSVLNLLKFAYHHGTPLLQEGIQMAEIALAAIALQNGYRTHDMYIEVRGLLQDEVATQETILLLARVFWRAYYNMIGLVGMLLLANMFALTLLDYGLAGKLF